MENRGGFFDGQVQNVGIGKGFESDFQNLVAEAFSLADGTDAFFVTGRVANDAFALAGFATPAGNCRAESGRGISLDFAFGKLGEEVAKKRCDADGARDGAASIFEESARTQQGNVLNPQRFKFAAKKSGKNVLE